jgi:hypothetical protein
MQPKQKHPRAPRLLVDRRSSAVATMTANPNLTTSVDAARQTATALAAAQPLVHYFDPYGGFFRVGRVIESHTVSRGKRKGTVLLTITTMPSGQVTRSSDEVKWVQ